MSNDNSIITTCQISVLGNPSTIATYAHEQTGLTYHGRLVLSAVLNYIRKNFEEGGDLHCYISHDAIARHIADNNGGCSRRTVINQLKVLKEAGYLDWELQCYKGEGKRKSRYFPGEKLSTDRCEKTDVQISKTDVQTDVQTDVKTDVNPINTSIQDSNTTLPHAHTRTSQPVDNLETDVLTPNASHVDWDKHPSKKDTRKRRSKTNHGYGRPTPGQLAVWYAEGAKTARRVLGEDNHDVH